MVATLLARRSLFVVLWLTLFIAPVFAQDLPKWRQRTGFDDTYLWLRADMPLGRGIVVGYVESESGGGYIPKADAPQFANIDFITRSGQSKPSNHATRGAKIAFGTGSIAPGVTTVHTFKVNHWLTEGYLRAGTPDLPHQDDVRLFNHSWISDGKGAAHVLRRVDWQIDNRDVVMCCGVNNGRDSSVPAMLASAYNIIAVGTAKGDGDSSGGFTRVERSGRCKPDIVGPMSLTSFATPSVTATCAILLEQADAMENPLARRAELIKAVLLAGAVKPKVWRNTQTQPLDEHYGAGIVNVTRSLQVLRAGSPNGVHIERSHGWSFLKLEPKQSKTYRFELSQQWNDASVVLTWHRRIDGRKVMNPQTNQLGWVDAPRLANIDLILHRIEDDGSKSVLLASRSEIDNVEHLYLPKLEPGRYRLQVSRVDDLYDEPWDAALAWRMRPAPSE